MSLPRIGDVIEIKVPGPALPGDSTDQRWLRAEVIEASSDTWPLARLADGQVTELRPFMKWRTIH